MSEPTYVPLNTGNPDDDDSGVIDSFFVEVDNAPTPDQLPVDAGNVPPLSKRPKTYTLMMSGYASINPSFAPQMILPADPERVNLIIRNDSGTATDAIRIADDPGKLQDAAASPSGLAGKLFGGKDINLAGHTGPVWVVATDAAAAVLVTWWAATGGLSND